MCMLCSGSLVLLNNMDDGMASGAAEFCRLGHDDSLLLLLLLLQLWQVGIAGMVRRRNHRHWHYRHYRKGLRRRQQVRHYRKEEQCHALGRRWGTVVVRQQPHHCFRATYCSTSWLLLLRS